MRVELVEVAALLSSCRRSPCLRSESAGSGGLAEEVAGGVPDSAQRSVPEDLFEAPALRPHCPASPALVVGQALTMVSCEARRSYLRWWRWRATCRTRRSTAWRRTCSRRLRSGWRASSPRWSVLATGSWSGGLYGSSGRRRAQWRFTCAHLVDLCLHTMLLGSRASAALCEPFCRDGAVRQWCLHV